MGTRAYVAVDLGAESGRVIVGTLVKTPEGASNGAKLELHEAHRFMHEPMRVGGALCWNVPHIWEKLGMRNCQAQMTLPKFLISNF